MKLQYKNNQWEDEKGIPIAPNDQEKMKHIIFRNNKIMVFSDNNLFYCGNDNVWRPVDPSKLYDSGDLEFECQWQQKRRDKDESHWIEHTQR